MSCEFARLLACAIFIYNFACWFFSRTTWSAVGLPRIAWAALLWWAASGIFAAAIGGAVIAALGQEMDDARKVALALLAWATAILLVGLFAALAAGGGASVAGVLSGTFAGALDRLPEGTIPQDVQRGIAVVAVSSLVALLLGAAAQVATAIYSPETRLRTKRA